MDLCDAMLLRMFATRVNLKIILRICVASERIKNTSGCRGVKTLPAMEICSSQQENNIAFGTNALELVLHVFNPSFYPSRSLGIRKMNILILRIASPFQKFLLKYQGSTVLMDIRC